MSQRTCVAVGDSRSRPASYGRSVSVWGWEGASESVVDFLEVVAGVGPGQHALCAGDACGLLAWWGDVQVSPQGDVDEAGQVGILLDGLFWTSGRR